VLQHDFQSSLGYWICATARVYERAIHQELLPEGITHRQCQVLGWLALEKELSQVDLADRMGIEPPTLVRILDRMERDGLLARESCEGDRRKKMIRALPKASTAWKKIAACARRIRERAGRGMTQQQKQDLNDLLALVQQNLGENQSQARERIAKAQLERKRRREAGSSTRNG
jgi:MarR family transcriptional regulator, transcriptional regulator for hemolysin